MNRRFVLVVVIVCSVAVAGIWAWIKYERSLWSGQIPEWFSGKWELVETWDHLWRDLGVADVEIHISPSQVEFKRAEVGSDGEVRFDLRRFQVEKVCHSGGPSKGRLDIYFDEPGGRIRLYYRHVKIISVYRVEWDPNGGTEHNPGAEYEWEIGDFVQLDRSWDRPW